MPSSVPRGSRRPVLPSPVILLAALGTALAGTVLAAPSNDDCLECHAEAASDGVRAVPAAPFTASVHGSMNCVDCHADATEIPHGEPPKAVGLDVCETCHADEVAAYRTGIHARGRDGQPVATCASCHGDLHAVLPHDDPKSAAHWTHLAQTCAHCHASREVIAKYGIPVVQPVEAYLEGVHGRAVTAGARAAVCSDCHRAHDILPGSDPHSSVWRATVPDTCGHCHAEVAAQYRESVHGVAAARGVRDAPVCTDCHGEHRILGPGDKSSPIFASNIPRQTCERCHGDARLAAKYGLPAESVASFEDSFHGLALRGGKTDVANCASCHGVHGIFAASDPRSLVNPANLAATCGTCHPGAGTRFAIGPVHVRATAATPTRVEHWIRLIYLWLIGLVVGFMALHVAVDLVVKARHWPPPPEPAPAHPAERMSRALRWQHGLVMLSFPVLVYTGFALTYPESWWARPLMTWETRLGLRGLIHRAAALVLLAALGWHMGQLCASPQLRARLRGLVPGLDDLRYFAARLRWYAGRAVTPPRSGACSYVEKLEYWAFIWGMLVMTLTGLFLWSSDLALRYFPKWLTDVATAIHFYEAVLAALAIAVWHLYWVVFDPEVYPMDWSWWNGQAPASRVRERTGASPGEGPAENADGGNGEG